MQGPEAQNPAADGTEPGAISLCLSNDAGRTCRPDLGRMLRIPAANDMFSEAHFLNTIRIVRLRSGRSLLLVQAASLHSGDGDQRVATWALAYDRAADRFVPVYQRQTGRNNNQEIRYLDTGPLRGDIIAAEPTSDAPYGYWVTVSALGGSGGYRQVLRYRSATHYGDGNPLPVIDSEMPTIERRLGLLRPGSPLPLPTGHTCPKPRLVRDELWCDEHPHP